MCEYYLIKAYFTPQKNFSVPQGPKVPVPCMDRLEGQFCFSKDLPNISKHFYIQLQKLEDNREMLSSY